MALCHLEIHQLILRECYLLFEPECIHLQSVNREFYQIQINCIFVNFQATNMNLSFCIEAFTMVSVEREVIWSEEEIV